MGNTGDEVGHQDDDHDPRANARDREGDGRRANASSIVVTFSIGAPMMNDSRKVVEAPRRTNDGAITDEQQEQKGCGKANIAPNTDPVNPPRVTYDVR